MCSDLFCAFQPKAADGLAVVAVVIESAGMPKSLLRFFAWLLNKVESSRFSIKLAKDEWESGRLISFLRDGSSEAGCGSAVLLVQVLASERPVTVIKSPLPHWGCWCLPKPLLLK